MEIKLNFKGIDSFSLDFLAAMIDGDKSAGGISLIDIAPELGIALLQLIKKELESRHNDRYAGEWVLELDIDAPESVLLERNRATWWWLSSALLFAEKNNRGLAGLLKSLSDQVAFILIDGYNTQNPFAIEREAALATFKNILTTMRAKKP